MKRLVAFCFIFSLFISSIAAAPRSVGFTEGYDKKNDAITFIGQGRNETEAIIDALEGLEHLIVLEISNRCSELSRCVTREAISDFIKFSAINITAMSRNILRYAYNSGSYNTNTGKVMVYSVKSDLFEDMLENYIQISTIKDELLDKKVPELVSVNRFLKKRYLNSESKNITVN